MRSELAKFTVVGTLGFLVDGGIMQAAVSALGLSPLVARAFSFPFAVTVTWLLNRFWTFDQGRSRSRHTQYLLYLLVQLLGFAINYASFAFLVLHGAWWRDWPIAALVVGSLLAMGVTYLFASLLVFSTVQPRGVRTNSRRFW